MNRKIEVFNKILKEVLRDLWRDFNQIFFYETIEATSQKHNIPMINIEDWGGQERMEYCKDYPWVYHRVEGNISYTFLGDLYCKTQKILYEACETRKDAYRADGVMFFLVDNDRDFKLVKLEN